MCVADRLEIERRVVPLGRRLEALVGRRHLVRDQPRLRHTDPEPHQRAVRRVLLHRLERERVVQQVDVVHQRDLLQPRARQVVPPRQTVDHERVPRRGAEVERLVDDPLGRELVAVDRPETARRAPRTRRASPPRCRAGARSGAQPRFITGTSVDDARSGAARTASRAERRGPRDRPRVGCPSRARSAPKRLRGLERARSCPPTGPGRRRAAATRGRAASRDGRRARFAT